MLTFVLDGLHEDLNRIRTKPYLSIEEQDVNKESDQAASERWWKNHLLRENSIIVDLFHGQFKTKITCPDCKRQCVNYDSFMFLSLPIPSEMMKLTLRLINFNKKTLDTTTKLFDISNKVVYIHENITVNEILSKFSKSNEKSELIIVNSSTKAFKRMLYPGEKVLSAISKENEAVIYILDEVFMDTSTNTSNPNIDIDNITTSNSSQVSSAQNYYSFYYNLMDFYEEKGFLSINKCIETMDYPYVVLLQENNTVFDLYEKIYYQVSQFLNPISNSNNKSNNKFSSSSSHHKKSNNNSMISYAFVEYYSRINLYIINNLPEVSGIFSTSKSVCEFCHDKCTYCFLNIQNNNNINNKNNNNDFIENSSFYSNNSNYYMQNNNDVNRNFSISESTKISSLLSFTSKKRSKLAFYLNLKEVNFPAFQKSFPKAYMNESFKFHVNKSTDINLFDCLEMFRSEEKLEQENSWFCNYCKKHQEANIKMQIYKPPLYLIIHFKRFKIKSGNAIIGFISNKKNDTFINYPIELDLKDYVLGNFPAKYDLFAINQHYGSLSSGHYTAICKNQDMWLEFDDESVRKANSKDIVSEAAYLLFYKLK